MVDQGMRYELILELLTQIKNGNIHTSELMRYVKLSRIAIYRVMTSLVSQGFLVEKTELGEVSYQMTKKGELFQEYLSKTLDLLNLKTVYPKQS
jgi:predicted transcriptional regulator